MITSSVEVADLSEWVTTMLSFELKMSDMEAVGKVNSYETEVGLTDDGYYIKITVDIPKDEEL
jgi:ribulose kinase